MLVLLSALAACGGEAGSSSSTTSASNSTTDLNSAGTVSSASTASSMNTVSSASTASSSGTPSSANSSGTATTSGTAATSEKTTIVIKESKVNGKDSYVFDPETLTVKKGDAVTVENNTDKLQEITLGDATKAGVETSVGINKSETMTFNKVGTFTLKSVEGAVITVTVTES